MKIRDGFVSNSSSSSFVCEICMNADTLYDGGLSEIGMCECTNGHILCLDHLIDKQAEADEDGQVPSDICPICKMKDFSDYTFRMYVEKRLKFTKKDMLKDINEKFKNYKEYSNYMYK